MSVLKRSKLKFFHARSYQSSLSNNFTLCEFLSYKIDKTFLTLSRGKVEGGGGGRGGVDMSFLEVEGWVEMGLM